LVRQDGGSAVSVGSDYVVKPGKPAKLAQIDPRDTAKLGDEESAKARLADDIAEIDRLQDKLYAEGRRSLLVILQGMDTSGKDGTVRGVFNATGPLGVNVTSFRQPSELELSHDFLWRAHMAAPRRGTIGIFNRSHYEDVLVVKVRKLVPGKEIERRYDEINAFEKILAGNGTTILKFMLHISKKEQKERLQERLDDPRKHWKFNPGDLEDRKRWDDYQDAYETMLTRCSTEWAPWRIIPADHKWARNAVIASIVRETLAGMDPKSPKVTWDPKRFKIE
jgi:PPK2 family polyphosphate:nucleotide phosphotransferase